MSKNEKLFRALTISGFVVGTVALARTVYLARSFNTIIENFEEFYMDIKFDEIVANYYEEEEL